MLRHAAACFQTPMCSSKKRVLWHAAACCGCTSLVMSYWPNDKMKFVSKINREHTS